MNSFAMRYLSAKHVVHLPSLMSRYSTYYSKPKKRHVDLEKMSESRERVYNKLAEASHYSKEQWHEFSNQLIASELRVPNVYVTESNIDGVILRLCAEYHLFDTGQKYFDLLRQKNGALSDVILSRYLSICALDKKSSLEKKEKIIGIYKSLKKVEMEPHVAERCISAICCFEDYWRESLDLFQLVQKYTTPTPSTYCCIAEACFTFGEVEKGWEMLQQLGARAAAGEFKPRPGVYIAYLDYCQTLSSTGNLQWEHLERLFHYLEEFSITIPSIAVVERIKTVVTSMSNNKFDCTVSETHVPRIGVCGSCRRELEPVKLTPSEFSELRKAFVKKAVVGSDVFLKTTPEEVMKFKNFLAKALPYDIVIDGLNIAYARRSKDHRQLAKNLQAVVEHFVNRKMKVLVLGRQHMKKWPSESMNYVFKNSRFFLAQNLSEDDPYMLLATLKGGESTCLISRDLMRSHIFAMDEPRLKRLFRNWLISHQYSLEQFNTYGVPVINTPVPFRPTAQKLSLQEPELCWHVPYEEHYAATPADKAEAPPTWLCINKKFLKN